MDDADSAGVRADDAASRRLVTYGTLGPGRPNHAQLDGLDGRWVAGHVHGTLVDAGWGASVGYPALVLDPDDPAVGVDVFESPDLPAHWVRLDDFEGPGYERVVTTVHTAAEDLDASIYVSAQLTSEGTLRLIWPQWQGGGTVSVRALAPEFSFDVARRGYAVGAAVLDAVLPPHDGPSVTVPVTMGDEGLEERDGVEAKAIVLDQLARALAVIDRHKPARIATLGGECSVSVAPFAALADRYGDDLAIIWIDSHPDVGTGSSAYPGYHAMAVSALTGHGDPDVQAVLPATLAPERVALVGLHAWTDDDYPHLAEWGLRSFSPDELRESSTSLLDWLSATGCSRVAVHFDVDTIDSNEIVLGLGAEPDGLTSAEVRRLVGDLDRAAEVVGITVAEFIPRQVMHLRQILDGFPLI